VNQQTLHRYGAIRADPGSASISSNSSPLVLASSRAEDWPGGDIEPYAFADIDKTVAAGATISQKLCGRADDTLGVAGVVNGVLKEHEAFLNAGELGILVGDGQLLHPGSERIIENYYSIPPLSWRATVDYQ
jgi:high affinity Mn2+ porin